MPSALALNRFNGYLLEKSFKMFIVRNTLIPFPGYIAVTLWPFIFVRRKAWPRFTDDTLRHERIHGLQQVELLMVGAALTAILMSMAKAIWTLVTSVVILVTRPEAENLSMLEKENLWML